MVSELNPPTTAGSQRQVPLRPVIVVGLAAVVAIAAVMLALLGPSPASAQTDAGTAEAEETEADGAAAEAEAELLREGQQVYSQICSSCHQPGGTGLSGQFPALLDNPTVDDSAYVADVINNGLQGEITALGETFDGVMPSFSTLTDDEIAALIAYMQADFQAPAAGDGDSGVGGTGPVVGTDLPALSDLGYYVAHAAAAIVALLVLGPRLFSVNDRLSVPWLDAWLKTASIVIAVYFLAIFIPNWALQRGPVAGLSRFGQDLIGTGLWTIGVAILLGGLWYAHRESRV